MFAATTLRKRAGHFALNNCWLASDVNALASNLVGCGIRPPSQHPNTEVRQAIYSLWDRWTAETEAIE
jgi:hypothetical protein